MRQTKVIPNADLFQNRAVVVFQKQRHALSDLRFRGASTIDLQIKATPLAMPFLGKVNVIREDAVNGFFGVHPLVTNGANVGYAWIKVQQLGFEVDHPWEDFIVEWVEQPGTPAAFTTEQCLYLSGCLELGYSAPATQSRFPPVSQKDSVEAGKILRRLGYEKDKHQRRVNGKKQRRMWRRVDASSASTPASLPEAGQTPTGGSEVSDPPHVSSLSIQKEQGQEEEQMTADALLGETPEAPEAPLGSGFDVQDMDERTMWDIPSNRSA